MNKNEDEALQAVEVKPYVETVHGKRIFQGIPGIETSGHGKLWVTWYGGGVTEGPDNFIMLAGSSDGGDTWSDVVSVIDPPGKVRAFDPGLWRSLDGRLFLFWNQSYGNFDGRAGVWISEAIRKSTIPEWGKPVRVGNGVMMNKPIELLDGTWVLPTAVWGERFSNLLISDDGGKTFMLLSGTDVNEKQYDEHMVVQGKSGEINIFVRTHYGIAARISADKGYTWRNYFEGGGWKHDVFRTGPVTRFFISKLSSGRWLMVYHEHPRLRCNLMAYLSDDEGKTWNEGLMLDERMDVSYPDAAVDSDGYIHVVYDRERYGAKEILTARFTEEDVLSRRIVDSNSRLKVIVNKA